jgi:hypothetical protein
MSEDDEYNTPSAEFSGRCEECGNFGRWYDFKYTKMRTQTTRIGWCTLRCYRLYHDLEYTEDELHAWEHAKLVDQEVQIMVDESHSDD